MEIRLKSVLDLVFCISRNYIYTSTFKSETSVKFLATSFEQRNNIL